MKRKFFEYFIKGRKFKSEFQRQLRMLIVVTLGFTIAFTWRQTIFDLSQSIIQLFTNIKDSSTLSILASILITIISAIAIYTTSYYLRDNADNY